MSATVTLRNVSPLGYLDVPILGREGPSPHFADCTDPDCHPEHEHTELVDGQHAEPGSGCLKPGEEFTTTHEIAAGLLEQVGNFVLVETKKKG